MSASLRLFALTLILGSGALAQPKVGCAAQQITLPPLTARATDLTGTLTAVQLQALEQTLESFEARKGSQIAVFVVPTTQPETIEQFGIRLAEQWKLGRKGVDDGAILIVARNDRTVRIEVGYGLEGVLNDATCKRIISEIIIPKFRQGDFAAGINNGVERIIGVVEGEPLPQPAGSSTVPDLGYYVPIALFVALFLGGFLRRLLGRTPGALITGGLLGYLVWLVSNALSVAFIAGAVAFAITFIGTYLLGPLLNGITRGGNRSTGFGGFRGGGGKFGGGGASGRW